MNAATTSPHHFLRPVGSPVDQTLARDIACAIMNYYTGARPPKGKKWWWKQPRQTVTLTHRNPAGHNELVDSKPFSMRDVAAMLERTRGFDAAQFGTVQPSCDWMDPSIGMKLDGYGASISMGTFLGPRFPLRPKLDREGGMYESFQWSVSKRVLYLRQSVVDKSHRFQDDEWFEDLRAFVAESVSLVDITLHQIYFKAKYNPLPGWSFDEAELGPRHGSLRDKLRWVYQITGRDTTARDELVAFGALRNLRNQLQHFDPPCFCYTMEEVADWLNHVHPLAHLLWDIRRRVDAPLSVPLIEMLLSPRVVFVPRSRSGRTKQPSDVGYASTRWSEPPTRDENGIRFQPDEATRLDAMLPSTGISKRHELARLALRIGIEALEQTNSMKPRTNW